MRMAQIYRSLWKSFFLLNYKQTFRNSSIQNKNLTLNIFHSNINKRLKIASKSTSTYHMNESEYQPFSPTEINTHKNASPSCRTLNKSFNNNNDSF